MNFAQLYFYFYHTEQKGVKERRSHYLFITRALVIYALVFNNLAAYSQGCFEELMVVFSYPRESGRRFHLGKYRDAIDRFKNVESNSELVKSKIEGPEEFLALYEQFASKIKVETLQDKVLSNNLTSLQKRRILLLEKTYAREYGNLDHYSIRNVVENFYLLGIATDANFFGRMKERWKYTMSYSLALRQRTSVDFLAQGLEEALLSNNLMKTSMRKKFRRWRRQFPNIEQTIVASAVMSMRLFQSLPVLLPGYTLNRAKIIPDLLVQNILNNGLLFAKPELKKMYGTSIQFNRAFEVVSLIYTGGMLAYYGYYLLSNYSFLRKLSGLENVTEKELVAQQEETFNAQKIRLEQLDNWKRSILLFDGELPTTAMIRKKWQELLNIPDEELKVKYQKND